MSIMGIGQEQPKPVEVPMEICLNDRRPKRTLKVGSVLDSRIKDELVKLLKEFEDVLAYTIKEMSGIDPEVVVHKLNIDHNQKPIWLRKVTWVRPRIKPSIKRCKSC